MLTLFANAEYLQNSVAHHMEVSLQSQRAWKGVFNLFLFNFLHVLLGLELWIKLWLLYMVGKCFTTKPHSQERF